MDFGLETDKSNIGIRINIVKTLCVPIVSQVGQLSVFRSKFAQKWIHILKFRKLMLEHKSPTLG